MDKINQITEKNDREMANSVLEVSIGANKHMIEELMGDDIMFETLMEIMEPKINEIRKGDVEKGIQKGRREGIQGTIAVLRKLNYGNEEIKSMIIEQYTLSEDEATIYLQS